MGEISEELREIARKVNSEALSYVTYADEWSFYNPSVKIFGLPDFHERLLGLADRIDSEYVELPLDNDGVPIKVGDTVYHEKWGEILVHGIDLIGHCWKLSIGPVLCGYVDAQPDKVTHERPDSIERIADELDEWAGTVSRTNSRSFAHGLAERLRKLAKRQPELEKE